MSTGLLEKLKDIPFQKIKDSPTVKYYTNWKIFESLLDIEYTEEYQLDNPYVEFKPSIVLKVDDVDVESDIAEVEIVKDGYKSISKIYARDLNQLNKMEAYHILRNRYILKLIFLKDFESYTVLSPAPAGYLPNHLNLYIGDNVKGTLNIVDLGHREGLKTFFVEVSVGRNADISLNYLFLHNRSTATYTEYSIDVDRGSKVSFNILGFGGLMTHLRSNMDLKGRESIGYTYGSLIAREDTMTDVITNVTHHGDYSESILSVRGGILDKGYLVHRGAARILNVSHEASTAVKSYLTIFGDKGTAHSIPMLEVDTGIVAGASHSTSVSRLDEYRLFYLRKMGLSDEEIIDMLLRAYVEYSGVAEIFNVDWRSILKD